MKKQILQKPHWIVIFLLFFASSVFSQIHSTGSGGIWTDTATWVGGIVPGPTHDVVINGIVRLNVSATVRSLIVNNTLQNHQPAGFSPFLEVLDSVVNYGLIQDDPAGRDLRIFVHGSIFNDGVWRNREISLRGAGNQSIGLSPGKKFEVFYLFHDHLGAVIALSDLRFENSFINFRNKNFLLNGNDLKLTGGGLVNTGLDGNNGGSIELKNSSYLLKSTLQNLDLFGNILVWDSCFFRQNVMLYDTLQNQSSSNNVILNVLEDFVNMGIIQDNPSTIRNLIVRVHKNVSNFGVWRNDILSFHTTQPQTLTTGNANPLKTRRVEGVSGCQVVANGDVKMDSLTLSLTGKFYVPSGSALFLNKSIVAQTEIIGDTTRMWLWNESYLSNQTVLRDLELRGFINVANGVTFEGYIKNMDSLNNYISNYTLTVNGLLENIGMILNRTGNFTLDVYGDICNRSMWTNFRTNIRGSVPQSIFLDSLSPISGSVWFWSNISGGSYQWYKNGQPISGANANQLIFSGLDTLNFGTYWCISATDTSRQIHVLPKINCQQPSGIFTSRVKPQGARLNWTPVPGVTGYQIRGRAIGFPNWVQLNVSNPATSFLDVSGLTYNVSFEWQVRAVCLLNPFLASDWSPLDTFTTGCYAPDSAWTFPIQQTAARLNWTRDFGAVGYRIRGRIQGASGWTFLLVGNGATTFYDVYGLQPGTAYEWQVQSWCTSNGSVTSSYSPLVSFTTNTPRLEEYFDNPSQKWSVEIFPNPTSGIFTIIHSEIESQGVLMELFDYKGSRVYIQTIDSRESTHTLTHLSPGVYFAKIVSGLEVNHLRLVIQH